MKYLTLKENGKQFSKIALGTTYFGTTIEEKSAMRMLDEFADSGGTTIDTALVYGQEEDGLPGRSEMIIGRWLKSNNMYKEMAIVTKGLHPSLTTHQSRISLEQMKRDLDRSFIDLGVDNLDLWFFHRDDRSKPVKEFLSLIDQISSYFPVTSFGVSNWNSSRLNEICEYETQQNRVHIDASEIQWSLAESSPALHEDESIVCMDDDQLQWYSEHQRPLFAYSSQAKGFFSKFAEGIALNAKVTKRFVSENNIKRAERVKRLSETYQCPASSIVLSYITSAPFPSVAIIGPSCTHQLEDSLKDPDITLTQTERTYLESGEGEEHVFV